ncbi:MAG: lysophospholipid acyltransferase family protein, partial [Bacteroidia bacterium]|nr:lysophospholipid acyltransferase family protein [Bacteroidia bacterium]
MGLFGKRPKTKKLLDTATYFQTPLKRALYGLFLKPGVERALGVDKLNAVYAATSAAANTPGAFAEAVLAELGVRYEIPDLERLKKVEGPLVVVANHPFGGLEALMLVLLLEKIRPDYRIMANYLLERVEEVRDRLVLVDPFDTEESKQRNVAPLKQTLAFLKSGGLLGVFPSGQVAALDLKAGRVVETEWNPIVARLIQKTNASVAPVFFFGSNSPLFHLAGLVNERLRTALLLRELLRGAGRRITFKIGNVISPETIKKYPDPKELTEYLRTKTYLLAANPPAPKRYLRLPNPLTPLKLRRMDSVAPPVETELLSAEISTLPSQTLLHRHGGWSVYCIESHQAPGVLTEIGRLREITFRAVGEGTGKALDLDPFDRYYLHLFIWNDEKQEIVGAYRIGRCDQILAQRKPLYLTGLFNISSDLYGRINPALELGRSFIRQEYQRAYQSLMTLWIGIGRFLVLHPEYRYLLGPASISGAFHRVSKQFMVKFLQTKYWDDDFSRYVKPRYPFRPSARYDGYYQSFRFSQFHEIQEILDDVEND